MINFWIVLLIAPLLHNVKSQSDCLNSEYWLRETNPYYNSYQDRIFYNEQNVRYIYLKCKYVQLPIAPQRNICSDCNKKLKILFLNTTTIFPSAFSNIYQLKILELDGLNLSEILPGAFAQLPLREINLTSNHLTNLNMGVFNSLIQLQTLDLSYNNVTLLEKHLFLGVTNLKTFNISHNSLTEFYCNVFDPSVVEMDLVDLSFNEISVFSVTNSIRIKSLYLNNNKLTEIELCPLKGNSLNLQNNLLSSLPELYCFDNLTILDISFNEISEIDNYYFENASTLNYLYLNDNNLSSLTTGVFFNLVNLKVLNLSKNALTDFQHGTFDSLHKLEILDLSYNKIITLGRSLHALNKLQEVYIQYNKLNVINALQLLKDSPSLQNISFDGNKISCEELITIIHDIRVVNKNTFIVYGNTKNTSNIHGIACEDKIDNNWFINKNNDNLEKAIKNIFSSVLKEVSNKSVEHTDAVQDYFNNDFKNSNFYKFLTNFQSTYSLKLNETQLFKYFNEDFEKSKFYKYLESLKDKDNETDFKKNIYNYFNTDFKQSGFVKYLEDLKNYKLSNNDRFLNSSMYNYFNKDFEDSKFYKYMENLRNFPVQAIGNPAYEKLVNEDKYSNEKIAGIQTVNMIFGIFTFLLMAVIVYKNMNMFKKTSQSREQVELIEPQDV